MLDGMKVSNMTLSIFEKARKTVGAIGLIAGLVVVWIESETIRTGSTVANLAIGEVYPHQIKGHQIYLNSEHHVLLSISYPLFFGAIAVMALMIVARSEGWISANGTRT